MRLRCVKCFAIVDASEASCAGCGATFSQADIAKAEAPFPPERHFACVYCDTVYTSPAGLEDGGDILCKRCGSRHGEVVPVNVEEVA